MSAAKSEETKKPVDLSTFDKHIEKQEAGIDVPLKSMDGETPLGVTIRIAGADSKRAQKANEEISDELIEEGTSSRLKTREREKRGIQFLAKLTINWTPAIVVDGQEMTYSEENAVKLYTRYKFIREQVDVAAGNRKRFMKG